MVADEVNEKLSSLAKRYKKVNGWGEKEILQFALNSDSKADIEVKLQNLERHIMQLEKESQVHTMEMPGCKQLYITKEERKRCRAVINAFAKEIKDMDMEVVETVKFGFVKLRYYKFPDGLDNAISFVSSFELFTELWEEWLGFQLLRLTNGTPIAEMDYDDIIKCLPENKQKELMSKREYFAEKAGVGNV